FFPRFPVRSLFQVSHARRLGNHAVDLLVAVFLEFKALYLFSLTFGIGVAVQAERAKLRDIHVEAFLVRRFLVLLAFGACHMLLVSKVDILALYAVCGLMVRWLRRYRFGPFEWLWRSMTYGRRQTHAR